MAHDEKYSLLCEVKTPGRSINRIIFLNGIAMSGQTYTLVVTATVCLRPDSIAYDDQTYDSAAENRAWAREM